MSISNLSFEDELRISLKPMIVALAILGFLLLGVSDVQANPVTRFNIRLLVLLLYAISAIAWLLDDWWTSAGRWFMALALVAAIELVDLGQGVPQSLALMAIPTGLAAALIGLPAAIVMAVGQTTLLLLRLRVLAEGGSPMSIGIALIAVWGTLGLIVAIYYPVRRFGRAYLGYYRRAQTLTEEALDRKVELEQALDDLAHANRQLALLNERLVALQLIAEEAHKAKAAFVAKVSHEFRTPLNMIIGLIDLMVTNPEIYAQELPLAVSEDLRIVHRNCKYLSSMVNDVLALSQAEAGRLALYREWVDLAGIVDDAVAVVRPLLDKKDLDLRALLPDDLPQVYCDKTRIRQVILNLLSNAGRFTETGGITIRAAQQAHRVVVSVSDTGPGIPPEDAGRIFEPFSQSQGNRWRDKGGSGLGLSISKQFIELHGGKIWLESEPGRGTTFSFELPVSPPIAPVAGAGRWISEGWEWVERRSRPGVPLASCQPRIVVCDATGDLCPALGRHSDEIELVDTRDVVTATQELRRCPAHAVMLNTASPNNLWSVVEAVRGEVRDTPIIGCAVPPQLEHALEAGAAGYLIKPVERSDLEKAIQGVGKPVRRILIADDDPDVLQLWTRLLRSYDGALEIATASDGTQTLAALRAARPDLVLLDILMPGLDGWQVLALKRRDEAICDVPVILVSAQDPTEKPPASQALLITMGEGIPLRKLLRCALELSALLLKPE